MSRQATVLSVNDVPLEPTRHGALKKVLIRHEDVNSSLMFLNEVYVDPGEDIQIHAHFDMEEIFYFLEGEGFMGVGEETVAVTPGIRFLVPARVEHYLQNSGSRPMRFICF